MITKFDSLFAGHIDMENAGYGGTAVNTEHRAAAKWVPAFAGMVL
jgi:hypothetical protein